MVLVVICSSAIFSRSHEGVPKVERELFGKGNQLLDITRVLVRVVDKVVVVALLVDARMLDSNSSRGSEKLFGETG